MSLSRHLSSFNELKGRMLEEGVLTDTFLSVEGVQDESDPKFVVDMVDLFFVNAEQMLVEINKAVDMKQINLVLADAYVHQLSGSASSLGVGRIKTLTDTFRIFYLAGSVDGYLRTVKDINQEYVFCKSRLMSLRNLAEQIIAAGGVLPRSGSNL